MFEYVWKINLKIQTFSYMVLLEIASDEKKNLVLGDGYYC